MKLDTPYWNSNNLDKTFDRLDRVLGSLEKGTFDRLDRSLDRLDRILDRLNRDFDRTG